MERRCDISLGQFIVVLRIGNYYVPGAVLQNFAVGVVFAVVACASVVVLAVVVAVVTVVCFGYCHCAGIAVVAVALAQAHRQSLP